MSSETKKKGRRKAIAEPRPVVRICGTCSAPIPGWECRCPACGQASYSLIETEAGLYADQYLADLERDHIVWRSITPAAVWSHLVRAFLAGHAAAQAQP